MTANVPHSEFVARRAEILAELGLQKLQPAYLENTSGSGVYDFIVGFNTSAGGLNTFAVEVIATEQPVPGEFPVRESRRRRLLNANIPVLLLVVDAKHNQLYYALDPVRDPNVRRTKTALIVPVVPLDDDSRPALLERLQAPQPVESPAAR